MRKTDKRPTRLSQQGYIKKNKDAIVMRLLGSNTSLYNATMPLDDSFETNPEVHVSSL